MMENLTVLDCIVISLFVACCCVLVYNVGKLVWYGIGRLRK